MILLKKSLFFLSFSLVTAIEANEFVIKKEKSKKTSMRKTKERYAQTCGDCIKKIPDLQKQAAKVQKILIDDINALLDDISGSSLATCTKEQFEERTTKIAHLTRQLEGLDKELKSMLSALK